MPVSVRKGSEDMNGLKNMNSEMFRFATFERFPRGDKPYSTRLAQAGFYFTSQNDEVKCYCCKKIFNNWSANDNPVNIHRNYSPTCLFFTNNTDVNIAITSTPDDHHSLDKCGRFNSLTSFNNKTHSRREDGLHVEAFTTPDTCVGKTRKRSQDSEGRVFTVERNICRKVSSVAVGAARLPYAASNFLERNPPQYSLVAKYHDYVTVESRIKSFDTCDDIVFKERLGITGFFYSETEDCIRCFFCGISLRHWKDGYDPWTEHARFSIDCYFMYRMKGSDFIQIMRSYLGVSNQQSNDEDRATAQSLTTPENLNQGKFFGAVAKSSNDRTKTGARATARLTTIYPSAFYKQEHQERADSPYRQEVQIWQTIRYCCGCEIKEASTVFLPCRHLVTCGFCAVYFKICPQCNQTIKGMEEASHM